MKPEDIKLLQEETNYWVDTSHHPTCLLVDGYYAIFVMLAAINLFQLSTLVFLVSLYLILLMLTLKDIRVPEMLHRLRMLVVKKKYRRY